MSFIKNIFPDKKTLVTPLIKIASKPKRENHIEGFIGVKKCGKSSTMRFRAEILKKNRPVNFEVHGYDPQNIFSRRINSDGTINEALIKNENKINPEDKDWALKLCGLKDCLVLLDELRILIPNKSHPPKGFLTFLSQSSFNNVDIMYSLHNPSQLPTICCDFTNLYFIFLTYSKEGSFEHSMPNSFLCNTASEKVNEYVRLNGKGKHKKDPEYKGQGFPYCVFDVDNQKLSAVNMNNTKK